MQLDTYRNTDGHRIIRDHATTTHMATVANEALFNSLVIALAKYSHHTLYDEDRKEFLVGDLGQLTIR